MNKLNLIEMEPFSVIVCDNPTCDYEYNYSEKEQKLEDFLNVRCPKCGENLLTEKDYKSAKMFMNTVNWINKWFGWTAIFTKKKNYKTFSVHAHDGLKIKKEEK